MHQPDLFLRFGTSLAIGLLIGLQREYAQGQRNEKLFAGVRTFPLFSLAGTAAALVADLSGSPWPLVAVILAFTGVIVVAYHANTKLGRLGATTESSAIVTILAGVLCYYGHFEAAAAVGVTTAVLLSVKGELHQFVHQLSRDDIYAALKFAVITAVILPVLPNTTYGPEPLNVLNPHRIWLMVVFISGISFMGYVLIKAMGPRQGIGLSGLLGGLVSSTAVTLSFAQRSSDQEGLARPLALAIIVSWITMYFRVIIVVAAINVSLIVLLWPPMLASALAGLAYGGYLYMRQHTEETADIAFSNPFELGPALKFGALYAVILLVSRAAQFYLGTSGVYLSSLLAGVVDLNAISLSLAELSLANREVAMSVAARALVMATVSNTVVKGIIVVSLGSERLRRAVWPGIIIMSAVGIAVVFLLT